MNAPNVPCFTRETSATDGTKLIVRVTADDRVNVRLDDDHGYLASLHPLAAERLGRALIKAARLSALNSLKPQDDEHANS